MSVGPHHLVYSIIKEEHTEPDLCESREVESQLGPFCEFKQAGVKNTSPATVFH